MKSVSIDPYEPEREEDTYARGFESVDKNTGYQSEPMFKDTGENSSVRSRRWRREWCNDKY